MPRTPEPQQYSLQKRSGPPRDGPGGTLAGIANPGDCLDILGYGAYRNDGTLASPRWVKRHTDNPLDGVPMIGQPRRS